MRNKYDSAISNNALANSVAHTLFESTSSTWLTATEAARYLKIKRRTIVSWARTGRIKAYPLTGTKRRVWRFLLDDLDTILIHSGPVVSSAQPSVLENERSI